MYGEQVLKTFMLNKLRYGAAAYELTRQDDAAFLYHLEYYHEQLCGYAREGNHRIQQFLDRTYLKITALADPALKMNSKCSFTSCKLRFFVHFCLVSAALVTF